MTDVSETLAAAHQHAGRAMGQLALALARRRVTPRLLRYVSRCLRETATMLDEIWPDVGD